MSVLKWLGASVGWSLGGPIGAIIGLALGSVADEFVKGEGSPLLGERQSNQRTKQKPNYRKMPNYDDYERPKTQSGDFEVSLLVLSSIVIKSDGSQDQRELDFVRSEFVKLYGKDRANKAFRLFNNIRNQKDISTRQVCLQIKHMMDHPSRLQLLHFLFGIAKADGIVIDEEERSIYTIAGYLGISSSDYNRIKAMFYNNRDNAYKILGLEKTASVDEIKKAYRSLVKKYHPDKVAHLGKEHQKGAEEKFKQIQKAYETIQKERGF